MAGVHTFIPGLWRIATTELLREARASLMKVFLLVWMRQNLTTSDFSFQIKPENGPGVGDVHRYRGQIGGCQRWGGGNDVSTEKINENHET